MAKTKADNVAQRKAEAERAARATEVNGFAGRIVRASSIQPKPLKWLWPGMVPRGKITILDGDPGTGKSLVTMDLAARLSAGDPLPDNETKYKPQNIILICAEDDAADTLIPRLDMAGADLSRIDIVNQGLDAQGNPKPMTIPGDLDAVEFAIESVRAALLIIDPIMAYMGEKVHTHNDASVRAALGPLKDLAQRTGCAVLMVRHLNKNGEAKALYRGGGSIAFTGLARSALIVDRHPEEPGVVVLAQAKSNLARMTQSYSYTIDAVGDPGVPIVEWQDRVSMSADALMKGSDSRSSAPQRQECAALIEQLLEERDPYPQKEIERLLRDAGFGRNTWKSAKKQLHVRSTQIRKEGQIVGWQWTRRSPLKTGREPTST
jgi:RecA-family ATPase